MPYERQGAPFMFSDAMCIFTFSLAFYLCCPVAGGSLEQAGSLVGE